MVNRVKKTHCGGTWTSAKYFGFIRNLLRQGTLKYPSKQQCRIANRKPYFGPDKRTKFIYTCEICKGEFKGKDTQIDHIEPAGKLTCYTDLPGFVMRLFCEKENMRVVCMPCHFIITKTQREQRKINK